MSDEFDDSDEESGEESCAHCGDDIESSAIARVLAASEEENSVQRDEAGNMLTRGRFYCFECAPKVAVCRVCGCTDQSGCAPGCAWIEPDLCSMCREAPDFDGCEPNCGHTKDEHEAFDLGVRHGNDGTDWKESPYSSGDPSLYEAYLTGHSAGVINALLP